MNRKLITTNRLLASLMLVALTVFVGNAERLGSEIISNLTRIYGPKQFTFLYDDTASENRSVELVTMDSNCKIITRVPYVLHDKSESSVYIYNSISTKYNFVFDLDNGKILGIFANTTKNSSGFMNINVYEYFPSLSNLNILYMTDFLYRFGGEWLLDFDEEGNIKEIFTLTYQDDQTGIRTTAFLDPVTGMALEIREYNPREILKTFGLDESEWQVNITNNINEDVIRLIGSKSTNIGERLIFTRDVTTGEVALLQQGDLVNNSLKALAPNIYEISTNINKGDTGMEGDSTFILVNGKLLSINNEIVSIDKGRFSYIIDNSYVYVIKGDNESTILRINSEGIEVSSGNIDYLSVPVIESEGDRFAYTYTKLLLDGIEKGKISESGGFNISGTNFSLGNLTAAELKESIDKGARRTILFENGEACVLPEITDVR